MKSNDRGLNSILKRLRTAYRSATPRSFEIALPMHAGGARPLERVMVLEHDDPAPHWLYVSCGLSELHEKKSRRADRSGWGLELTFRLERGGEPAPPTWPLALLQGLAGFVFRSRQPFHAGAQMDLNGPVTAAQDTGLTGVLFALDPKLGGMETPHGHVDFLQVIPVHAAELEACSAWSTAGVLRLLERAGPGHITDLARPSLLADPASALEIEKSIAREGSSLATAVIDSLEWLREGEDAVRLTIGAHAVGALVQLLAGRSMHGKRFQVDGPANLAVFDPSPRNAWRIDGKTLVIELTPQLARAMHDALAPGRAAHAWPDLPRFTLEVTPSEIRDPEGDVIRTIG